MKRKNSPETDVAEAQTPAKEAPKKADVRKILNIVITILTAVATTFGLTSCLGI